MTRRSIGPCDRRGHGCGHRRSSAFGGERSRADLHGSPVPSAEPRPRGLDPRGRPRVCDRWLLRRPAERSRDQGHQHGRRAASPLGKGALANRVATPRPRIRGPSGEASSRQRPRVAPLDGRSTPKRGRARRHGRPRAHRVPALLLAHRGHGSRQLIASLSCQSTAGCPQSDLAKTWVRNVRLEVADYSDPTFTALDRDAAWRGLASRRQETVRAQASDSGSGLRRVDRDCRTARGLQVRTGSCDTIPGTVLRRAVCSLRRVSLSLDHDPNTAQAPFRDGRNARLDLRGRLRRQPDLRHPHREGRQYAADARLHERPESQRSRVDQGARV